MQTVTSFPASAVQPDQLSRILADYLALDRARIVRRLLVARFGFLALLAGVLGGIVHGLSPVVRSMTIGPLLLPPVWAWMCELRLERRLSRHLDGVDVSVTHRLAPRSEDA